MRKKDSDLMNRILTYISEYYLQHDATPSTTEIAEAMDIARGTAYKYLVAMNENQMLTYRNGQIDTDSLPKIQADREEVSALGKIACGDPVQEEEHLLYKTSLPTAVFGKGPFYILYAKGDSMEDAGIEEGDILVIRKNADPKIGDIIVALDECQENTLKRYGGVDRESQKVRLEYQNQAVYGDKVIFVNELICQGVLSHVIKQM
ncbi:MAG: S24 family peptidase [Eubacteriales bacterium]|nr:S24 family peptidase [Eubacteriales bacterium]